MRRKPTLGDRAHALAKIRRLRLIDQAEVDRRDAQLEVAEIRIAAYLDEIATLQTERQELLRDSESIKAQNHSLADTVDRLTAENSEMSFRLEGLEK